MGRRIVQRGKAKKKPNRYNPNQPSYGAVHVPWWFRSLLPRRR